MKRGLLLIVLIALLLIGGGGLALAQTDSIEITLFIAPERLALYVPAGSDIGVLENVSLRTAGSSVALRAVPDFTELLSASSGASDRPLCVIWQRIGAVSAPPPECQGGVMLTQQVALADAFWFNLAQQSTHTISIVLNDQALVRCEDRVQRCTLRITAASGAPTPVPFSVAPPARPAAGQQPAESADFVVTRNAEWSLTLGTFAGVEMALVPAGCFTMGGARRANETPPHVVCIEAPFWIDRYEVTNAQYGSSGRWPGDELPRDSINWFEARSYCAQRGGRLPSEAEWEFAARGPDGLTYPWGSDFVADFVSFGQFINARTARVGSRPGGRSWVGAHDMSGNLWEWTSTIYDQTRYPYPYNPNDGRENPADPSALRVLRGGAWYLLDDDRGIFRATYRFAGSPESGLSDLGVRCVRDFAGSNQR
ncbi:MAG: formylglycine-generating enzyme family protein [Chloroflexi bacterium]|nr:formylglycine-generating enzyme family protein [Chloroflexota bacterium]